ncbi:MAG: hypothetical protein MUP81_01750 [Dehalococcoidia bacterium]|nr:hypothetical protein [Dehalococcoidia bacterium]
MGTIKRQTVNYYVARRAEIVDILAHGCHSPDYIKMLEGARDMATERIQQLTEIAANRGIIVASKDDRTLQAILDDVLKQKQSRIRGTHETKIH